MTSLRAPTSRRGRGESGNGLDSAVTKVLSCTFGHAMTSLCWCSGAKPPARLARRFPPLRAPRVRARPATNGRTTVTPPRTAAARTLRERAATARSRSMRRPWFPALPLAAPCRRFGANTATNRWPRQRIAAEARQRIRPACHTHPAAGRRGRPASNRGNARVVRHCGSCETRGMPSSVT